MCGELFGIVLNVKLNLRKKLQKPAEAQLPAYVIDCLSSLLVFAALQCRTS